MKNYLLENLTKLSDEISSLAFSSKPIKIAITGLSQAGKTVFITSLIDQLLHQNSLISLKRNKAEFKVSLKAPLHNAKRFDYYSLIDSLKNRATWPKGTDGITHTILEFESKSRFSFLDNSTFSIELIDYPGEWLLDLTLLELSYQEWSKQTLLWLESVDDYKAKAYLLSVNSLSEDSHTKAYEEALHVEYKELIIHLKKMHYSQLTPGRFIMPSDLANDPILVFAPIKGSKALEKIFAQRYDIYVREVVKGIHLEHFKGFERQVVLVDVIEALENSYAAYSDMREGLKKMLKLYDHNNKNFIMQYFTPSIKKVLFVASKADQVSASQHANFSLLLEDLVRELEHELSIAHISTDTQIISALKSTKSIEKTHEGMKLSFVRGILADDSLMHDVYPGEMPSSFPSLEEYDSSNYAYKSFLPPKKSYKENEALEHINMDKLIDKLLGDLL